MPVIGFLLDRALLPSGARVSIAGWRKPVAEAEIAAYIGADLSGGAETVRSAIAAIGPAIELQPGSDSLILPLNVQESAPPNWSGFLFPSRQVANPIRAGPSGSQAARRKLMIQVS
jgi:hypothetical protein